jgi:cobalt-zinc-cadmium efflux system protein
MAHAHHDHDHHYHDLHHNSQKKLLLATIIVIIFSSLEAGAGWWSNSLTLLSDAGHMAADAMGLGLAAFAAWIANRPISQRHTYGFGRAEIIAAWISSISLIAVTIAILIEAIHRLRNPHTVAGNIVIIVAIFGFITNLLLASILGKGEKTLNTKSALLHILGDLLGSIIVLISGAIIYFSHWSKIDPILSIGICCLILFSTFNLLYESLVVLMEGAPKHINPNLVKDAIAEIKGVLSIHDFHIWTLTSGMTILSGHIVIHDLAQWPKIICSIQQLLLQRFKINHVTLQPETPKMPVCGCNCENSN